MTINLHRLTEHFDTAVYVAEQRWAMLKHNKYNPRMLARYTRSLRRCHRLRKLLSQMMEQGKL
jgi:hypothetical protein